MNKHQDNRLALSVVATLTAGIALIYVLITYPKLIFAVAGTGILFLICSYILTQNIVAFVNVKNKSLNVQIKNGMDDLANQIEGMSSAQAQLGKATYLYTRQAAENVATLRGNYADSQEVLFKNLSVLANAQSKSTKLLIKYDQNNTTKLISTLKDIKNHLSETMTQGFDQVQPNNSDVVAALESIVEYLKSQPGNMDQALGLQINNVAHELQNISSSIARVQQVPVSPMMPPNMPQMNMGAMPQQMYQEMPPMQSASQPAPVMPEAPVENHVQPVAEETPEPIANPIAEEPIAEEIPEPVAEEPIAEEIPAEEIPEPAVEVVTEDVPIEEALIEEALENEPVAEEIPEPVAEEPAVEEIPEAVAEAAPEPVAVTPVSDDPNKQLSPDEIAALFAASGTGAADTSNAEPSNTEASEPAEEKPFTPTFTVVGKSEPEEESAPEQTPAAPTIGDVSDPNKQLSADEIAALFAAAEPAPKKEEPAPAPEPVAVTPISEDPNKQLSADEIAALFAAAEPAPKAVKVEEPAPAPEPVAVTPVSDDPNKQLSPDEIAALFASIG